MTRICNITIVACLILPFLKLDAHAQNDRPERKYTTPTVEPMDSVEPAVYPPSWWRGMEMDTIELMFHGMGLKSAVLHFDKKGIQVLQKDTVENSSYLFMTVRIEDDAPITAYPFTYHAGPLCKWR